MAGLHVTDASPRISVIIPAYRSGGTIRDTLAALRAQTCREFETVVVDSSPGDATAELVAREFPEVVYEHSPRRLIPYEARNRGVELACGELLVFTDPDCVPRPNWLALLIRAADDGHPVVGGSIEDAGVTWFERGVHFTKFSSCIPGGRPGGRAHLATANLLWGRGTWERLGPFLTDRWSADTELCWRARDAGIEPRFEPGATVKHQHEIDVRGFLRERYRRGEDFAEMRMRRQSWTRVRAAAYVAAAPVIPLVLLSRALRDAARADRLGEAIVTTPLQLIGYTAWALGECQAHSRRALGSISET